MQAPRSRKKLRSKRNLVFRSTDTKSKPIDENDYCQCDTTPVDVDKKDDENERKELKSRKRPFNSDLYCSRTEQVARKRKRRLPLSFAQEHIHNEIVETPLPNSLEDELKHQPKERKKFIFPFGFKKTVYSTNVTGADDENKTRKKSSVESVQSIFNKALEEVRGEDFKKELTTPSKIIKPIYDIIKELEKIAKSKWSKAAEKGKEKKAEEKNEARKEKAKRHRPAPYHLQKRGREEVILLETEFDEGVLANEKVVSSEDNANKRLSYIRGRSLTSNEIRHQIKRHTRRTLSSGKPPDLYPTEKTEYLKTASTTKDVYDNLNDVSKIIRLENLKRRLVIDMNDDPKKYNIASRLRKRSAPNETNTNNTRRRR